VSRTARAPLTDPFGRARRVPRSMGRRLFGGQAARYDRARPEYPARVFEILERRCGLRPGAAVFEVGPGTGKASREILRRRPSRLALIEPDPRLRRFLRGTLPAGPTELVYVDAPFERARLPAGTFDVGVAATSFHWLPERRALRKVARLLRPGGGWAEWWSLSADPYRPSPFARAVAPLFERLPTRGPRTGSAVARQRAWRRARLAALRADGAFEGIGCVTIHTARTLDTRTVVDLHRTFGDIVVLSPAVRRRFLADLRSIADDRFGGRVTVRGLVTVFWARRRTRPLRRSGARGRRGSRRSRSRASRPGRRSR